MFDLNDSQQRTARVIADGWITAYLRLRAAPTVSPTISFGETLLANAMLLAAQVRMAFAEIRPITPELLDVVVDLLQLNLYRAIANEAPHLVTEDVQARIAELEQRRRNLDLLSGTPAGNG